VAAWTAAITDGGGTFHAFGPGSKSVILASGQYAVTFDVAIAPKSTQLPRLTTTTYDPEWTTCGDAPFPEPACTLRPTRQPWAQFGDTEVETATLRAQITAGWARMTALDVVVTGGAECAVTVSMQADDASWAQVGAAPFAGGVQLPLTVPLDTMLTVTAGAGIGLLVETSNNCTILANAAGDAVAKRGDGVYGAPYSAAPVALVGGVRSLPACASTLAVNRGRSASAEIVTPASTTAYSVRGWDPETVVTARFNLFAQTLSDSRTLVANVFPGLLVIPNSIEPALTFTLTNINLQGVKIDPYDDFFIRLKTAIANAFLKYDNKNMNEILTNPAIMNIRISFALALDYPPGTNTLLPVSVQTSLKDITAILGPIEEYVNRALGSPTDYAVRATGGQPVSRVEVLVYTKPDSNVIVTRGLIRDQYNKYIRTNKNSAAISIGEVFRGADPSTLVVPALSKIPLYASSIASGVWALALAGVSLRARSMRTQ